MLQRLRGQGPTSMYGNTLLASTCGQVFAELAWQFHNDTLRWSCPVDAISCFREGLRGAREAGRHVLLTAEDLSTLAGERWGGGRLEGMLTQRGHRCVGIRSRNLLGLAARRTWRLWRLALLARLLIRCRPINSECVGGAGAPWAELKLQAHHNEGAMLYVNHV